MPNSNDILFSAMSSMTGGLITDLTTAMIGMFTIGFIIMGFDYLKDVFESSLKKSHTEQYLKQADRYYTASNDETLDPVYRDFSRAKYNNAIRNAAK